MAKTIKILLIDDHKTVQRLLEAIVRIKQYRLIYADNGRTGIVMARQEQPDLIVLDVMMPDLDGFKICQYLKDDEATRHIPVLFLTARGAEDDLALGRQAGAEGFMTKPFQTTEVLTQIERMLATRPAGRNPDQ